MLGMDEGDEAARGRPDRVGKILHMETRFLI